MGGYGIERSGQVYGGLCCAVIASVDSVALVARIYLASTCLYLFNLAFADMKRE